MSKGYVYRSKKLQEMLQAEMNTLPRDRHVPWVPIPYFVEKNVLRELIPPRLLKIFDAIDNKTTLESDYSNFYIHFSYLRDILDAHLEPFQKRLWLIRCYSMRPMAMRKRKRRSELTPFRVWLPYELATEYDLPILQRPWDSAEHRDRKKRRMLTSRGARQLRQMLEMDESDPPLV